MSCQECERLIFEYSELTSIEKEKVNAHLEICKSCMMLFNSASYSAQLIKRAAGTIPILQNPVRLTNDIMNRISKPVPHSSNLFDFSLLRLKFKYVQYAMAAVSIFLLFFLAIEQLQFSINSLEDQSFRKEDLPKLVILNRNDFRQELNKSKATAKFFLANNCINPFKINQVDAQCLKQKTIFYKPL